MYHSELAIKHILGPDLEVGNEARTEEKGGIDPESDHVPVNMTPPESPQEKIKTKNQAGKEMVR